jgi:hypothetical protein
LRRVRTWTTRAGIVLVVAGIAAVVFIAATWKHQLIAWHVHECRRLSTQAEGVEVEEPSAFFHALSRFTGFPGKAYFTADQFNRLTYHVDALKALGFLGKDVFLVDLRINDFDGVQLDIKPARRIISYTLLAPDGKGDASFRAMDFADRISSWEDLAARDEKDEELR